MKWLKNLNKQWILSTNDILYTDFKENLKPTSDLNIIRSDRNKSVIYIPTHNIHDVYEWYRIFKDSYTVSEEFDRYGYAIHGYFNKDRGESIQGWFPNLIKVKATSTDTLKYYYGGGFYNRSSVDYITSFTNIPRLFVDGVEIFNEELVLLKNQYYETLNEWHLNTTLTVANRTPSNSNTYYIYVSGGNELSYKIGNKCIITDNHGNYTEDVILSLRFENISGTDYIVVTTNSVVDGPAYLTDAVAGTWSFNSFENNNGVYQYLDGNLTPVSEMYDKYKTYNQIVYTYQGLTNENKEFYLRRFENRSTGVDHGKYPVFAGSYPLKYSDGEAYLIKCEINYNLDLLKPVHPVTAPPYASTTDAFRMLFLDNTMADKVIASDSYGVGTYDLVDVNGVSTVINMGPGGSLYAVQFLSTDKNGKKNIIGRFNNDRYFLSSIPPSYTFRNALRGIHSYNIDFDGPHTTIVQNTSTSTVTCVYNGFTFNTNTIQAGDFVDLKYVFFDNVAVTSWTALNEQFLVISVDTTNPLHIALEIYPKLDTNFYDEFTSYSSSPNAITLNVDVVNTYDYQTGTDNMSGGGLVAALNKTIIGNIYDLSYYISGSFTDLKFNNIKQSHKYKWENHGAAINIQHGITIISYAIDHVVGLNYRQYFKEYYNVQHFVHDYLDCCPGGVNIDVAQSIDVTENYENTLNSSTRLGIEGTTIYFGHNYKEFYLDSIKKDTAVKFTNNTTAFTQNVWVHDIVWNVDNNVGEITLLNKITATPSTTNSITLSLIKDIPTISSLLYTIFSKEINDRKNPYTSAVYDYAAYKPDTASYAYGILNYAVNTGTHTINSKLLENITGIVYKEYNEPRISFLRRDKNFKFASNNATLMDPRLTLKPVEIAKLGVDNLTQPWQKINSKYDSIESPENQLNIQLGINNVHKIRFIDGLTEYKIINNINGQGQYAWILDDAVIVDDAIVGCTKLNGPGTGDLIWYTGTWEDGVWEDGIWIQGDWKNGTWLNGTWNAHAITDYYYSVTYSTVQDNLLSTWESGTWITGTWNGGIANTIVWNDGVFNYGVINDGHWITGTFNDGVINHIVWDAGTFYGGDFETGIWYGGLFQELTPAIPARFGTKSIGTSTLFTDKAIWYNGIFDGAEFHSGNDTIHNGSVWYSGEFRSGDFYGGSFITGTFKNATWHNGVWFGGYYVTDIADGSGSDKSLNINPAQYDEILGLTVCTGYIANTKHRLDEYSQTSFILAAIPLVITGFVFDAYINEWDIVNASAYSELSLVSTTDTNIVLTISAVAATDPGVPGNYQAVNPSLHQTDGRPFIYAKFQNATWKNGIWLNGYFDSSVWETGSWINGYLINSTFGLI